jgi:hypothetical protein
VSQLAKRRARGTPHPARDAPTEYHATLAGACILEHAAALRELLAERSDALVTVDLDPDLLERAADACGPPPPPDLPSP